MIYTIAWRNAWRSKIRTAVVIFSIALGIWGGLSTVSLSYSLNEQRTKAAIESMISHVQIHHPEFVKDRNVKYDIENWNSVVQSLESDTAIKAFSYRVEMNGMLSSAAGGSGVAIHGINPQIEQSVTTLFEDVIEGTYLEGDRKNQILISAKTAAKLNVKMRSKLVLTFQDSEGNIQTGLFRVGGIFKTSNSTYDEANVFVRTTDLWRLFGDEIVHEIAVLANSIERASMVRDRISDSYPDILVEDWKQIAPELAYADEMMETILYIFIIILMLAMAFGIVNTMMMAVLERRHELGMLMAVGMNKGRVFRMILLETLYLGLAGGPLGLILSYLTISYFQYAGLNLSTYSEGLESVGLESIIHPQLESSTYWFVAFMVVVTALLSAISPARRALKLNPTEAIRSI